MPDLPSYPRPPMTLNIGTQLQNGKYIVQSSLLAEGFSVAYRATHTGTNQSVLLKTLHPSLRKRQDFPQIQQQCIAQIRRLAQCHHPHLVRVLDYFTEEDHDFWVIDDNPGISLVDLVQSGGPIAETLAIHYLTQVSRALTEMHNNDLLHGGIQPRHIRRLSGTEAVVVTDLGLVGDSLSDLSAIYPDRLAAGYAAPEQYQSPVRCTPATDVYGLAATLYYLVTGHVPVSAPLRQQQTPLPSPRQFQPEISPALEQAILQGLAIAPEQRPAAIADWLKRLPQLKSVELPQGLKRNGAKPTSLNGKEVHQTTEPAETPLGEPLSPIEAPTAAVLPKFTTNGSATSPHTVKPTDPRTGPGGKPSAKSAPPRGSAVANGALNGRGSGKPAAARKPAPTSANRWLSRALALTAIVAASAGAGVGFAFRLNPEGGGNLIPLNTEQAFPPSNNWPGFSEEEAESFFENPVVLEDELQPRQHREHYGEETEAAADSYYEPSGTDSSSWSGSSVEEEPDYTEPVAGPELDPYVPEETEPLDSGPETSYYDLPESIDSSASSEEFSPSGQVAPESTISEPSSFDAAPPAAPPPALPKPSVEKVPLDSQSSGGSDAPSAVRPAAPPAVSGPTGTYSAPGSPSS